MTIWYVDPENGNDSNNGQSFANRKKTFNNPSVGNGDEIRFIKSPEPTSLGNGSWERHIEYIDKTVTASGGTGGAVFDGQSAGNPTTVASNSHGLSTGDAIYVIDTYTYAGVHQITKVDDDNFTLDGTENAADTSATSETFYKLNAYCVRLASSPIKNIICYQGLDGGGDLDWTAVDGTTNRETTNWQSGYRSARWFKAPSGTSGKLAYVQLNNALDLSGYQQISFRYYWDYNNNKDEVDYFSIRLCSDTSGDTTVHQVPIKPPCGDDSDRWGWYTHDFGTNLNSSIQSIAIHADTASNHNNTEIQIDNVIACKAKSSADSLHLGSVIGKGTTHMSRWYPIMSIVDKIVLIQSHYIQHDGLLDYARPYTGATETVTTYKRECFTRPDFFNSNENEYSPFYYTSNHWNLTISGGWNTTDMSTQDTNAGTWLGLQSSMYSGLYVKPASSTIGRNNISNFGIVRGYQPVGQWTYNGEPQTYTNMNCVLPTYYNLSGPSKTKYDNCIFYYGIVGIYSPTASVLGLEPTFKNCTFLNNLLRPIDSNLSKWCFIGCTFEGAYDDNNQVFYSGYSGENRFSNVIFSDCTFQHLEELFNGSSLYGHHSFVNCTFSDDMLLFSTYLYEQPRSEDKPAAAFINYNNTANDHRLYYNNTLVVSDTSVTQSGSGISWKMSCFLNGQETVSVSEVTPLAFKLAEVAVNANAQVTATVYARRSKTGTNMYVALAARAFDNAPIGITTDVKSSATDASADTWQQLTLTFTPTRAGVATISALMSTDDAADNVWVDTFAVSQA